MHLLTYAVLLAFAIVERVEAQTLTLLDNTADLVNIPSNTTATSGLQLPKCYGVVISTNTTYFLSRIDLALTSGTGERRRHVRVTVNNTLYHDGIARPAQGSSRNGRSSFQSKCGLRVREASRMSRLRSRATTAHS